MSAIYFRIAYSNLQYQTNDCVLQIHKHVTIRGIAINKTKQQQIKREIHPTKSKIEENKI